MNLYQMTLSGGLFILLIVAVRALALHRLPKGAFLALWEMAALRLLLPFTIPLPSGMAVPMEHLPVVGEYLAGGGVPVLGPPEAGAYGTPLQAGPAPGLGLPVVYNCSGYEKRETLESLKGTVDIYLTDFKYMEEETARNYSRAADYPDAAKEALAEMVRQQGEPLFLPDGRMERGVIVRHLLLPGHVKNAEAVVEYVFGTYGNQVYLSLMNQYTPISRIREYPNLNRRVTKREYNRLLDYALALGVEQGFFQEGETAGESFIPGFDGEGLM